MTRETKPTVKEGGKTFELFDIRLGRIISVGPATSSGKPAYRFKIDFGKFGERISVGRFTQHAPEELVDQLVVAVMNLGELVIDGIISQVLVLGLQYPSADSHEATPLVPLKAGVKVGGKVF